MQNISSDNIYIMSDENRYLQIYKGNCYTKRYQKRYQKIIVLDLDETLGSFGDLHILWTGIQKLYRFDDESIQSVFNSIMELYPEFLRHGVLSILDFLNTKKTSGHFDKLFIYTNNICPPPWITLIVRYINERLQTKRELFDKIISAFKINNKIVELSRTRKEKSVSDLIRCVLLPKSTEICFIDDTYHKDMIAEKVYYIQPYPYYHGLSADQIIQRFIKSSFGSQFVKDSDTEDTFFEFIQDWFFFHKRGTNFPSKPDNEMDMFVAKKMMYHIKDFFYLTSRKNFTRRKYTNLGRKTRKTYDAFSLPIS